MAVADIGVAMGPRNRRRFTTGGIVLGMLAALVAAGLLTRPFNHSGPTLSAESTGVPRRAATFVTDRLIYGMSKQQVLRRAGRPAKTVGACWQYREDLKIRNGQNTLNAQRVCFLGGVYAYDYSEIDGNWNYP